MQPRDPKAPPPDLNLPVFMGPLNIPQMPQPKRKRRWKLFLVWTLAVFAGGVAAGPFLTDQGCMVVERVAKLVGMPVPSFVANRRQSVRSEAPALSADKAIVPVSETSTATEPAPAGEQAAAPAPVSPSAPAAVPAPAVAPAPIPEVVALEPDHAAPVPAPREPKAAHRAAATPAPRAEAAEATEPHPQHGKGAVKAAAGSPKHKASDYQDPFAGDVDGASDAKPASTTGKTKAAPSETTPAKREPSPKPTASKSNDLLDNLMADGASDTKGKKRDSKDLDALLKDVQKSKPEPVKAKREEPAPASALSSSDISRVMAGVKVRANECAHRLSQPGNAEMKITVSKDGAVTDVQMSGKAAGTPLGACIEKATRAAKFPASSGLKFDYRLDAR